MEFWIRTLCKTRYDNSVDYNYVFYIIFNCVVDHIQSKLTRIQFSLIPKPVLNLFTKRGVDSVRVVPSDIDTKIPSKLLSALMEFQREGVELVLIIIILLSFCKDIL